MTKPDNTQQALAKILIAVNQITTAARDTKRETEILLELLTITAQVEALMEGSL